MPPSNAKQRALSNQTDCRLAVGTNKRLGMPLPRTDIMHDSTKVFWLCSCDHAATAPHLMFTSRKVLLERLRNCPTTGLSTKYCVWSEQLPEGEGTPRPTSSSKRGRKRRRKEEEDASGREGQDIEQPAEGQQHPGGSGSNRPAGAEEEEEPVAVRRRRRDGPSASASALELALVGGLQVDCWQLLHRFVALLAWLRAEISGGVAEGTLDKDAGASGLAQLEQLHSPLARSVDLGLRPGSPLFVTEARSLPGRCKSSVDVSLLRPIGESSREGWPFGAVIQIDGQQHLHGMYCSTSHWIQRNIDCANDLAAWRHCMPLLRIAYSDRQLIPSVRRLFVLTVLANPGTSFIMYTRTFYNALDWDWALRLLGATWICRLPTHGVFLLANTQLLLVELDQEAEEEMGEVGQVGQGFVAPGVGGLGGPGPGSAADAAAAAGPSAPPPQTPSLRSMYDEPAGPSGLQPVWQWRQKQPQPHLEGAPGGEGASAGAQVQQQRGLQRQQLAAGGAQTSRVGQLGPQVLEGPQAGDMVGAAVAVAVAEEEEDAPPELELEDEPPAPALFEDLRNFVEGNFRRRGAMLDARRRREEEEEAAEEAAEEEAVRHRAARARAEAPWGPATGRDASQSDDEEEELRELEEGRGAGGEQQQEEAEAEKEEGPGEPATPPTRTPAPSRRTQRAGSGDARSRRKRGSVGAAAPATPDTRQRCRTPATRMRARSREEEEEEAE
ncbi:hypothetical protein PLESTB_001401100 [Pleodorina starrii]|uniref:Uncharacterized protein n=1 Tax=Pleodorina starrii TaxID=330485 RepID=A0A9W6BV57_9CHLO|nr:hypothetical protein PLESTM_000531700 [Pleodorina starrii]GLC58787.1 hypothetical protein PLESTB_001401100 [Pleodorina starrii]GLC68720.1 hypothetical protein PLESTF_000728000 [Pleodorina starrii]